MPLARIITLSEICYIPSSLQNKGNMGNMDDPFNLDLGVFIWMLHHNVKTSTIQLQASCNDLHDD